MLDAEGTVVKLLGTKKLASQTPTMIFQLENLSNRELVALEKTSTEEKMRPEPHPATEPHELDLDPRGYNRQRMMRRLSDAERLTSLTRSAPRCDTCVLHRKVITRSLGMNYVDEGLAGVDYRETFETRSMCAHPAYSDPVVDFTVGRVDFAPRYTTEQARADGSVCGPPGNLHVQVSGAEESLTRLDFFKILGAVLGMIAVFSMFVVMIGSF